MMLFSIFYVVKILLLNDNVFAKEFFKGYRVNSMGNKIVFDFLVSVGNLRCNFRCGGHMIKIVYPACWNLIIRCANEMLPCRVVKNFTNKYARLMK